jgi:hypothetical protein
MRPVPTHTIDFLFGFQPSQYGEKISVTKNVKEALCIYNPNWFITSGLGNYEWTLAADNPGEVVLSADNGKTYQVVQAGDRTKGTFMRVIQNYDAHPGDNDPTMQAIIIEAISRIAGNNPADAFIMYGLGGSVFDPAGGETLLITKIKQQCPNVDTHTSPYQYYDTQLIADGIVASVKTDKIIIGGDSLGANDGPVIAAALA